MTLQRKFSVLLCLFGLTVAAGLAAALWSANALQREIVDPMKSTTELLDGFFRLKHEIGAQIRLLPGPGRDEPGQPPNAARTVPRESIAEFEASYRELSERVRVDYDRLAARPLFKSSVGAGSSRALRDHLAVAQALAFSWFAEGDVATGVRAGNAHFELHELIERIESKVIAESGAVIAYGDSLRFIQNVIIASAMAAAALCALLGVLLVRRWVTTPVALLRGAALQFAAGNLDHRVVVQSDDDLGRLSSEVNDMASTIKRMQTEAIERERLAATGEMVRRLTHNIRNPLSGIRGMAELTARRVKDNPEVQQDQQEIIKAVDRFNVWLTELLEATSPMEVTKVESPVKPWLEGIVDSHRPLARMRSIELATDFAQAPAVAHFDPKHLEHALVALVTNALQATPSDGTGRVRMSSTTSDNNCTWEISIADNGPGIPEDLLPKIFRPYFTTKRDGNGIGLAVAQLVVKRHEGDLEVITSTQPQNRGTTFVVRVPIGMPNGGLRTADLNHSADASR